MTKRIILVARNLLSYVIGNIFQFLLVLFYLFILFLVIAFCRIDHAPHPGVVNIRWDSCRTVEGLDLWHYVAEPDPCRDSNHLCYPQYGGEMWAIRFPSGIICYGDTNFIGGVPTQDTTGLWAFDSCHSHQHFYITKYQLLDPFCVYDERTIKLGFAFQDAYNWVKYLYLPYSNSNHYFDCNMAMLRGVRPDSMISFIEPWGFSQSPNGLNGLTNGYIDIYFRDYECQWLIVKDSNFTLPSGYYIVRQLFYNLEWVNQGGETADDTCDVYVKYIDRTSVEVVSKQEFCDSAGYYWLKRFAINPWE